MPDGPNPDNVNVPPFRDRRFAAEPCRLSGSDFFDPVINGPRKVGNFKWGVYAFFDYDDEPIYVGQTNEQLRTRIRRHLTNQRTDAVAMSVLDPFEVFEIEVWPLPQFQTVSGSDSGGKAYLDALEHLVYENSVRNSRFGAILNEKDPPEPSVTVTLPPSFAAELFHMTFIESGRILILESLAVL